MKQVTISQATRGNSFVSVLVPAAENNDETRTELRRLLEQALERRGRGFYADEPVIVYQGMAVHSVTMASETSSSEPRLAITLPTAG